MAEEIKLPPLGENVPGGDVVEIKVAVGDAITQGQELIEVEAEKSTVPVPSPVAGKVTKVLVKKGQKITTGQAIVVVESGNGQAKPAEAKQQQQPDKQQSDTRPQTEVKSPDGKRQAESKQTEAKPFESRAAGAKPQAERSQTEARPTEEPPSEKPVTVAEGDVIPAGPATRRLAREWGVNLGQVAGSGPRGRVTQDDVKTFVRTLATGGVAGGRAQAPPLPEFEKWGPVERKPLESIHKKTAEAVTLSWTTIPAVTQHDLADVTDIEAFRKQQEGKGPKLTVTAFVLKACAIVLKEYPQFNASLDAQRGELILKHYYHLGVAVDTEHGLVVPVLRDVDSKSVHDIGKEMTELAERARQRKLRPEDMQGATFTISNLGGIGGTAFTPIVNWPQVAILGLSRSRLQPVYQTGQLMPRLMLPLSLTYDHRVIDGADAARFARRLVELLENPLMMLLHA
jgi:pyruvate dehydrogenase E2 component (dihydrolipoamide acetyltransferase)